MSDVPELDKILEERRIFKSNISWEISEKINAILSRLAVLLILFLASIIIFGPFGIFTLLLLPQACRLAKVAFPDPLRRDAFVRYMLK